MSLVVATPMSARNRLCRAWSVNTTVVPLGRLQEKYEGWKLPAGRAAAEPTPRTCRPASTTRSPRGPQEKSPGLPCVNRQWSSPGGSGEKDQILPAAAKEITDDVGGAATPSHPAGSEPNSRPVAADEVCADGGAPGEEPALGAPSVPPASSWGHDRVPGAGLGLARQHGEPRHLLREPHRQATDQMAGAVQEVVAGDRPARRYTQHRRSARRDRHFRHVR